MNQIISIKKLKKMMKTFVNSAVECVRKNSFLFLIFNFSLPFMIKSWLRRFFFSSSLTFALLLLDFFASLYFWIIFFYFQRDHVRVRPLMIVCAILSFVFFANVFSLTLEGIIGGIVLGLLNGYFFVVLYSLFENFRLEHERGFNVHYQPRDGKV